MRKSALPTIAAFIAGAALVFTIAACEVPPTPVETAPPVETTSPEFPTYSLPPCASEDSDNCYWDAARMGNGQGDSFVTLQGVTYYPR